MEKVKKIIHDNKIIAIVRGVKEEHILMTAQALYEGGIRLIEVTYNQSSESCNEDTYQLIEKISKEMGKKICVGAGTVMTVEQVELSVKAGAKYILSPNFNEEVVAKALELGVVSIPGVLTPSEITAAYDAGASFVKVFPAGQFGTDYIKAIRSPISHIPMLAVGGINKDNMKSFIEAGVVGVGIGSCLVNNSLIEESDYGALKQLSKDYVDQIK